MLSTSSLYKMTLCNQVHGGNSVRVFNLTGADGSSACGQLTGRQHNAEDGSTLLICTLAPLQRQVLSVV